MVYAGLLLLSLVVFLVTAFLSGLALYLYPPLPGARSIGISLVAGVPLAVGLLLVGFYVPLPTVVAIGVLVGLGCVILAFVSLGFIHSRLFRALTVSSAAVAAFCIMLLYVM